MDTPTKRGRMLGSVSYRASRSRYEIRVRERPGEEPTSTYVPAPGGDTPSNRARAELALADRLAHTHAGGRTVGRRLTVGRWLNEWLELKGGLKETTRRAYAYRIDTFLIPTLGNRKLADLEAIDVQRAMDRIARMPGERTPELSVGTVDAAYRVLSAALNDAWRAGKAPRNAALGASVPRPDTRVEPPTQAELDRIEAALADSPYRLPILLLRWTGARVGEVLGLEWQNVNLGEAGTVTFHRQPVGDRTRRGGSLKSRGSRRTIAIPRFLVAELEAHPQRLGTRLVFSTRTGEHIDGRNVLRHFDTACAELGIAPSEHADLAKYRLHDYRHAFATLLLEAGALLPAVSHHLGHSSLEQLNRYQHVRAVPGGDAYHRVLAAYGPEVSAFGIRAA
jgi:integrase